jgi:transcriptional regulator with XRE-family HTH domain
MIRKEDNILKNIVQIRIRQQYTQKYVAEKIGVSEATYNRIESGKIALSYEHLADIASSFSMPVIDVITWPETYVPRIAPPSTKVLVELDVSIDEFIKMGLKDKIIQVLNR